MVITVLIFFFPFKQTSCFRAVLGLEQKVEFPYTSCPQTTTASTTMNILHKTGTFVESDELLVIRYYHSNPTVHMRVHSQLVHAMVVFFF